MSHEASRCFFRLFLFSFLLFLVRIDGGSLVSLQETLLAWTVFSGLFEKGRITINSVFSGEIKPGYSVSL